ncbi:MAG: trypsin-like peptidase domain-containing protein [Pirellulaceae bacterium]|nr:trypsin-like peptidase domain-containing protein [Pirellulaceae bacterium]
MHPLDRPDDGESLAREHVRIRLAWAKLLWLLSFLAVLLGISYLVPFIAENTQYAITRGRQRAEYDFALEHFDGSPVSQFSRASQQVSQIVGPSVVHINTQGSETDLLAMPMRVPRGRVPTEGQGSGFVVDVGGYVLTNYHVVRDAREIQVSLADGRRVVGRIVGIDKETDLALLKINADKLTPIRWGDSDDTHTGALVWAVGSPFGLERSITSGILSAKHRAGLAGTAYQDFLQTDAAVNPGNSGGPLVNGEGRVIGVNTAIVGEAFQGISFAVPSNVARDVCQRLRGEGSVRRGWLGVQLDDLTDQHAKDLGLPRATGAYIAALIKDDEGKSPAATAGVQRGDVILRWNDVEITGPASLSTEVAKTEIGSSASIVVWRDGQELTLGVTVGLRPEMPVP